jgi:hypothetical protein
MRIICTRPADSGCNENAHLMCERSNYGRVLVAAEVMEVWQHSGDGLALKTHAPLAIERRPHVPVCPSVGERLFVNRRAYTMQSMRPHPETGRHYYFRPSKKGTNLPLMLTDETIRQHLEGKITVGLYAINPSTQRCKWVAIDASVGGRRDTGKEHFTSAQTREWRLGLSHLGARWCCAEGWKELHHALSILRGQWPRPEQRQPSHLDRGDPRFYKCWAGCTKEMIRAALGCPIRVRSSA